MHIILKHQLFHDDSFKGQTKKATDIENVKLCRESLGREKPGRTQLLKLATLKKPTPLIDILIEFQLTM